MRDDKSAETPQASPEDVKRSYMLFLPVIAFMFVLSALFLR